MATDAAINGRAAARTTDFADVAGVRARTDPPCDDTASHLSRKTLSIAEVHQWTHGCIDPVEAAVGLQQLVAFAR